MILRGFAFYLLLLLLPGSLFPLTAVQEETLQHSTDQYLPFEIPEDPAEQSASQSHCPLTPTISPKNQRKFRALYDGDNGGQVRRISHQMTASSSQFSLPQGFSDRSITLFLGEFRI